MGRTGVKYGRDMKKLTVLIILILSALTLLGADLTGTWTAAVVLICPAGPASRR